MSEQGERFDSWAVVELFGHQKLAGRVAEQTIGGCSFLRLDVPEQKYTEQRGVDDEHGDISYRPVEVTVPPYTKFLTQGAIYCMTPCSEDIARKVLGRIRTQPIQHIELSTVKALPAPAAEFVAAARTQDDDDDGDRDDRWPDED